MKAATVALIIKLEGETPNLVETLSDDREIHILQTAVGSGEQDPLQKVYAQRELQSKEDEEFGDYVEDLLCQKFLKPEIQEHAVQWLRSKVRIEEFQKNESQAAKVIADYAYKIFQSDPERKDFFLAGPSTKVRIIVYVLDRSGKHSSASDQEAA
jgi:hypothetical protein